MYLLPKNIQFLLLFILFFTACGSEGGGSNQESNISNNESPALQEPFPLASNDDISDTQYFKVLSPRVCTQENQNRFIYQVMHDSYLWASTTPELDYRDTTHYNSNEKILEALRDSGDHFSFIIDKQEANSYFQEGKNDNFGFAIQLVPFDQERYALVVTFVYPDSPADKAGFKRGDIITLVANQAITEASLDAIVSTIENQDTITFTLWDNNLTQNKSITKNSYDIKTILYSNIFDNPNGNQKIGYMVFQDFIDTATQEINALFTHFKNNHIDDLILDLRYNGGGSVDVAKHLASLIGGIHVSGNIFHHVTLNETYSKYNFTSYFERYNSNELSLNRVFILTTNASCSASELVINALRASVNNIEVIQIGSATCGKPYGFIGSGNFCEKSLFAINMETKNSDNVGDYTQGLTPTCLANDNIFKDFGDPKEDLLKEALLYISTNHCGTQTNIQKADTQQKVLTLKQNGFKKLMPAY